MAQFKDQLKFDIEWGHERLVRAQQTVEVRPYDVESWSVLIREGQSRNINEVRSLYESLVSVFPTTARYWKIYIEQEMKYRNYERVEKLFQRCLVKILNIDLWKLYLTYVKETKAGLSTHKEKLAQAYDFALGEDRAWICTRTRFGRIIFRFEECGGDRSYAENQKITAVYQRAVITPIIGIEHLWKEYIMFEQNINPIISEKMSLERSRDYMNARRVAKELEIVTKGLNRNLPAVPPTATKEELKQVELWKKYVNFERSNPLRSEDTALVTRRVMFATEQCLLVMTHHPAVWHQAAQYLDQSSKQLIDKGDLNAAKVFADEAANILERAINSVLSRNALLYFAYADFEEGRLKYDKVHQMYNKYLSISDIDPTLAYIQYMKFARRAEGIISARAIFKKAREDIRSTYHVFVAAALMEYYCTKDKDIAFRIFELGLKRFGGSPEYVMCYIDYLSHLNEDNNTRVLFERVLSSGGLTPQLSVEVWNRFLEFESNIGDLSSIVKVERRRSAVLEKLKEFEGKETAQLVDRYKFLNLYPCSSAELKSIGYTETDGILNPLSNKLPAATPADAPEQPHQLPRPDFAQMIPYKPKPNAYPGEHPLDGGCFPQPPALAALCSILPPPICFHGPFVSIDKLADVFSRIMLPDIPLTPHSGGGDNGIKLFDLAKAVHWIVDDSTYSGEGGLKRRRMAPGGDDSDEEGAIAAAPPVNDVYRARQQKRFNR
ncbi:suppressor of forked [Culex quinquefasciatus]|uniref:Suppressor of forked n=1 Tax=Culex quinquefasciatus TaxID=7176 RepID=B0W9I8_CULQU|nr:suppressor of forked [Culex quinquefasciatus]|eukprot:XP_001845372.1 suppressor of forked [Culex quinquefasciatus]